jgi:ApaG protein
MHPNAAPEPLAHLRRAHSAPSLLLCLGPPKNFPASARGSTSSATTTVGRVCRRTKPHAFVYFITIRNGSDRMVTLLGRKWVVEHCDGTQLVIEGDKIVGETPRLAPGEHFSYNSYHVTGLDAVAHGCFHGVDEFGHKVHVRLAPFAMQVPKTGEWSACCREIPVATPARRSSPSEGGSVSEWKILVSADRSRTRSSPEVTETVGCDPECPRSRSVAPCLNLRCA